MEKQGGQHGADSARFRAAGVAEGERIAVSDVPQDDFAKIPQMGNLVVGKVFGEDLQLRDFPPLLQPFGILDGARLCKARAGGTQPGCAAFAMAITG